MWHFPEDRPFNIHDKDGQWAGCRLVEEDAETVTVDYWNDAAQQRMRAQIRKEDIRCVSYPISFDRPSRGPLDEQFEQGWREQGSRSRGPSGFNFVM